MPSSSADAPVIFVLAGVNGAGKSSVAGAMIREAGLQYFNPDEAATRIRQTIGCSADEANSLAWKEGKERLEAAIRGRVSHAFESTLAGTMIPALLVEAARAGMRVLVWFIGLKTPEQHIARVRSRVAAGGHDIPEAPPFRQCRTSGGARSECPAAVAYARLGESNCGRSAQATAEMITTGARGSAAASGWPTRATGRPAERPGSSRRSRCGRR